MENLSQHLNEIDDAKVYVRHDFVDDSDSQWNDKKSASKLKLPSSIISNNLRAKTPILINDDSQRINSYETYKQV